MKSPSPARHRITLPTGVTLDCIEQGDPSGPTLLLLHGYTDSWRSWERLLPHLPGSLHVYALSQRGHGDSSRPDSGYSVVDFAADAAAFLEARGHASATVVGHSLGSFIAQRVALDHSGLVERLVLIGSAPAFSGVEALAEAIGALSDPVDPAFVREFQRSTFALPVPSEFLDLVVSESLRVPADTWKAILAGMAGLDHRDDLGRIAVPTLLQWGAHDAYFSRADQEALLSSLPRSQLAVYASSGHAPHWEEPEACAVDLVRFLGV